MAISVDYMVLADAAAVGEGKHYIHGGGWDRILASRFPAAHPVIAVAFLLRVPWNDTNVPQRILLDVVTEDGVSILPNPPGPTGGPITVGRPPNVEPGTDQVIPYVFNFVNITFPAEGTYVFEMRVGDRLEKRFPLRLQAAQPPGAALPAPQP